MFILGISCYYHDSAAAIVKDGIIIAAAEEERFSRRKHDSSFPKTAIDFCLRKARISPQELSYVVFYEKPFLKFERLFLTSFAYAPRSSQFFRESMKKWFFDNLWIKSHIVNELKINPKKILFGEHHLSHAASSFYCSPFKKSALLTIDGVGEWTTITWGIGNEKTIDLKEEINFPNSLGLLYSAFTHFAGYEVNEGEYKLMGLAPYGKPYYKEKIYSLIDIAKDGSFSLDNSFFSYAYSLREIFTKKFIDLFGKPKCPGDEVIAYFADIAASIQAVLEEILIKIVNYVHKKTKQDYLCYAGGVAYNSVANWKILTSSKFKDIFIQPAAGDSGGAIGCALWAYHTLLKHKRTFVMKHVYLGDSEDEESVNKFLKKEHISHRSVKNENLLIEELVEKITQGKVVGWVQEEFEWGPRALGHRSILADPRKKEMRDNVNRKIKFREAFRPFAPSVIINKSSGYFKIDNKYSSQFPFKFMLYVVPIKKDKIDSLGAVTHIDGTARPQLVERQVNSTYYDLIKSFGEKTGVSALLNTSFNLKGEPIVNTSHEAYNTFARSGIDILVLNKKYIIEKK